MIIKKNKRSGLLTRKTKNTKRKKTMSKSTRKKSKKYKRKKNKTSRRKKYGGMDRTTGEPLTYNSDSDGLNIGNNLIIPPRFNVGDGMEDDLQLQFLNQANNTITSVMNSMDNNPDWREGVEELSEDDLKKINSLPDGLGIDGVNILSMNPLFQTNKIRFQQATTRREVEDLYRKLEIIVEAYYSSNYTFSSEGTFYLAVTSTLNPIRNMRFTRQAELNID